MYDSRIPSLDLLVLMVSLLMTSRHLDCLLICCTIGTILGLPLPILLTLRTFVAASMTLVLCIQMTARAHSNHT